MTRLGSDALPVAPLGLLAVATFAAVLTEVLPVGLLPQIARGIHASQSTTGLLVSVYAVIVAVGSLPLAALVSRWPRRPVLTILMAGYAVSNLILSVSTDFAVAMVARLVGGLTHAAFFAVAVAYAVDLAPAGKAGRAVSIVLGGNAVAFALGVPLGSLAGSSLGWRPTIAIIGVAIAGLAVAAARLLPDATPGRESPGARRLLGDLFNTRLLTIGLLIVVVTLGHYTVFTYVTAILRRGGVAYGDVGAALFGFGVGGLAGIVIAARLADRAPLAGLRACAAVIAGGFFVLSVTTSTPITLCVLVAWGTAYGALPTLTQTTAIIAAPHATDTGTAMVNATFNVGIAGGAFFGSRELTGGGAREIALTGAILVAVALVVTVLPTAQPAPPEPVVLGS